MSLVLAVLGALRAALKTRTATGRRMDAGDRGEPATVALTILASELPHIRILNCIRVAPADMDAFLSRQRVATPRT
jgi:hypothetical protein